MNAMLLSSVLALETSWSLAHPTPGESDAAACECCASPRHKVQITRRLPRSIPQRHLLPLKRVDDDDEASNQRETVPQQSPIDIHENESELVPTYSCPNAITISMGAGEAQLACNDHGFMVQWTAPRMNTLIINGKVFHAAQLHFHTPSEHTMDGVHEELEMHLVHQAADGTLAVVGVLFREGTPNAFLGQFWDALADVKPGSDASAVPLGVLDADALDVATRSFFRYRGSLTTPPYTEGVEWVVIHDVMEASREQLDVFHNALPGTNARELQPLNDRHVWLAC